MSARAPSSKSTPTGGARPRQRASPGTANADAFRDSVLVFAALGDKTRLHLVSRLCAGGPLSITRLSDDVDVTRQAVTKHLNILAGAGLVRDIRVGRERLWEVETRQLEEARRCLDRISCQWDEALARLKSAVEEGEEH
jgi:DNA-binding transcriptional ArsR family regulator